MFHIPIADLLFPPRPDERLLRDTLLDDFLPLTRPRLIDYTRPGTAALLPFNEPVVRSVLHEAKYHGSARAFQYLGAVLAQYLADTDTLERQTTIIVPIPLGTKRLRERGYNQVEEIVRSALKLLGKERTYMLDPTLLSRVLETPTQVGLPREQREVNMRGAFAVTRPPDSSCTYLLIDDVITTGATLQSALDTLIHAGTRDASLIALAH